ncbi:hypothetical protein EV182_000302 [Spiromyces aspiralis]|uniref:Uncharacterized protein n=1 Tax=Spiromyces aspiralis TaxID=68401 RepID=A0ACC1I0P3_9FUNG|nr:hypothetical protein EV182_000302 [Spiromyces aspiralis]
MLAQYHQASEYLASVLAFLTSATTYIHAAAYPLASRFVALAGASWPPFHTYVTAYLGVWPVTILVECVSLYLLFHTALTLLRWTSRTLYRLVKFTLMVVLVTALSMGVVYYYFFQTETGRRYSAEGSRGFVVELIKQQAYTLFSQLVAPMSTATTASTTGVGNGHIKFVDQGGHLYNDEL